LALGDVHGCYRSLQTLLDFVDLQQDDLLVGLGDYIDRGPASNRVLEWLIERYRQGGLVPLKGNHEQLMLQARSGWTDLRYWLVCGGNATVESYGEPDSIPSEHWRFIEEACLPYYETSRHIFVHANLDPGVPLDEQPEFMLYWERFERPEPHFSGKVMVCGHTAQRSGLPVSLGHAVCIDTWVYGQGWLTCLEANTGHYWQANEAGETREGDVSLSLPT
jgi:serine/threonine protein phosphatase 1